MMQLDYRVVAVLFSLAIVCVLSILGSFICWMNDNGQLNERSQLDRWKWMVVVFLLLTTMQLLEYRG